MPVYNGAATIAAAINSALAQRCDGDFEVIVANDGSTDRTTEVLAAYGDRIRIIDRKRGGVSAARNSALRAARGDYVAFLDADDLWDQDKIAVTVAVLDSDPECGLAYSDMRVADASGRVVRGSYIPSGLRREPSLDDLLRGWWYILPSAVVMRRSVIDAVGGFDERLNGRGYGGEDSLMWISARERCRFRLVPRPLVTYRTSDFVQTVRKRANDYTGPRDLARERRHLEAFAAANNAVIDILRSRYGARVNYLARGIRRSQAGFCVTIGLDAMAAGDPQRARLNYAASLRRFPWQIKVWFRIAATFFSPRLGCSLGAVIPGRLARALWGPPTLDDRMRSQCI